jgi:hypothetical protein
MIRNNTEYGFSAKASFGANNKIYCLGNHWNIGNDGGTGIFLQSQFNTTGVF